MTEWPSVTTRVLTRKREAEEDSGGTDVIEGGQKDTTSPAWVRRRRGPMSRDAGVSRSWEEQ